MQADKDALLFIGTGIMGAPMARNLAKAGFKLTAWNRSPDKARAIVSDMIACTEDLANLRKAKRNVIIMLSTGTVVDEILFGCDGGGGIAQQLEPGSLVIVMSSIPVETARAQSEKLAAIGVSYIDAPVSGGERGAIAGTLTIMAGGEIEDIERARPLFEAMGRVTRVGPAGTGQLAKLANQTIVGITIGAVAEALLLAEAGGADISAVREALTGGFADSTILRQHGQRMAEDRFEPGAHAHVQLKDLSTAAALAEKFGLDSPLTNLTKELYTEMCEGKARDLDHSALYLHLKKRKNAK